eukprot:452218-Amphidinium_carterae.1
MGSNAVAAHQKTQVTDDSQLLHTKRLKSRMTRRCECNSQKVASQRPQCCIRGKAVQTDECVIRRNPVRGPLPLPAAGILYVCK